MKSLPLALALSLALAAPVLPDPAWGASAKPKLESVIESSLPRVEAFEIARAEAARLGVRLFLGGGAAATFARYSRDRMKAPDQAGWSLADIYQAGQDIDLVVDGPAEAVSDLKRTLNDRYPLARGAKSWDFSLLREDLPPHIAILSRDFLDQNNDSYSSGLIELTTPPKGERRIRDVLDPKSARPRFLTDIERNEISFYRSASHAGTRFAREGENPEIVSVLRYLYKAFQSGASMKEADLQEVKRIVDRFDPKELPNKGYLWDHFQELGRKMIMSAQDLEFAWKVMDQLGLRRKLVATGDRTRVGSVAWLAGREPLASEEIKKTGWGQTARELFDELHIPELVIAHETSDLAAYESIMRGKDGKPNFFLSHQFNFPGETAVHGDGVYFLIGESGRGKGGSGVTIRLALNPDARRGRDFDYKAGEFILKNREAVRVIREDLSDAISLEEVIKLRRFPALVEENQAVKRYVFAKLLPKLRPAVKTEITRLLQQDPLTRPGPLGKIQELLTGVLSDEEHWQALLDETSLIQLGASFGDAPPARSVQDLYRLNGERLFAELPPAKRKALETALVKLMKDELARPRFHGDRVGSMVQPLLDQGRSQRVADTILDFVMKNASSPDDQLDEPLLRLWFTLPESRDHPEVVKAFLSARPLSPKRAILALDAIYADEARMKLVDPDFFVTELERLLPRGDKLAFDMLERGLVHFEHPEDPRLWRLLNDNLEKFPNFQIPTVVKSFLSPRIAALPEAEAFVERALKHLSDQSGGWPHVHFGETSAILLSDESWAKKEAATRWMNDLLTLRSPDREEELDKAARKVLEKSETLREHPLHQAWQESLSARRLIRRLPATMPSAPSADKGTKDCPSLFRLFWNPFGL